MPMSFALRIAAAVLVTLVSGGAAWSAELYVAQNDPAAADTNAGTEAKPFKTIQPAVDASKVGGTIYIKAGTYTEAIRIHKKSGTMDAPITISAWKEDHVVLGSIPQPLPGADAWKPIPGTKCYSTVLPQPVPEDMLVLVGDTFVVTQFKDTPPKDDQIVWATYRKSDRTLMFNANGKNPAAGAPLRYIRKILPLILDYSSFWAIRNLEFNWTNGGIYLECCTNCLIEDCYFHHGAGIGLHAYACNVRRCNFNGYGGAIGCSGAGPANIIEDNLIVDCGANWDENINNREINFQEGAGPTCFKGPELGLVFRYNTVSEGHGGSGWYADVAGKGSRIVGNAFWNIPPGGDSGAIYNELGIDDSLIMGNAFYKCGVASSYCARMNVVDNYFDESSIVTHNRSPWPYRNSYMVIRGNAFVNPGGGYLAHFGGGEAFFPEAFGKSLVDYNRIRVKEGGLLINDASGGHLAKSIEDIRKIYGWEMHGEVKTYDPKNNDLTPEAMGGSSVTYRIPWGKRSFLARPMLSNADVECVWPGAPEQFGVGIRTPGFFWRIEDGNHDPSPLNGYQPCFMHYFRNQPDSMAGYGLGEKCGARWYVDAEKVFPKDMVGGASGNPGDNPEFVTSYSNGNHFLVMEGRDPEKMLAQGVGYWSPLLATVDGAKVTVSMRIRGKDIVSTDKGSPAVWVEFTNETGQNRQRAVLVGKDAQGRMQHEEFTKGGYDWKELKETVTAPKDAIRMALFFGVLPCKGHLDFDDINIKTASEAGSVTRQILEPRLPIQRIRETFIVDLSNVVNRSLADDKDNDGKGGWTDQGSECDMRELATGKRKFGGVPFEILPAPKSVVVLKSSSRAAGDLPKKVTILVGRKLDTIFFLHSAAWLGGGKEYFHYVIHYADEKDVTLSVGQLNLADWIDEPVVRFPNEEGTFSTVAETVKVPQFSRGSIYRMEWSAPLDRRPVEIKSIEFVGNGSTVPVLLGITGVTEW